MSFSEATVLVSFAKFMVFIHIPGISLSVDPTNSFMALRHYITLPFLHSRGYCNCAIRDSQFRERGKLHLDTNVRAVREGRVQSLDDEVQYERANRFCGSFHG